MDMDDGTLRKKTLMAILTIGGGCTLFLAVAGGASFLVSRAGTDSKASSTLVDDAPKASPRNGSPSDSKSDSTKPGSSTKPAKTKPEI